MKKYEYIKDISVGHNKYNRQHAKEQITYEDYMNILGQEGWEIFPGGFAKREIEPNITIKRNTEIER